MLVAMTLGRIRGRAMRVLIADDHPLYREALRAQIERLFPDTIVDEVASFDEVMRCGRAPDTPYGLFLVDFHMPGMSATGLRDLAQTFPDVPIAVISGTADAADVRTVVQAGVRGFIPKTASGMHLMHALQLLLAGGTSVPADFIRAGGSDASAPSHIVPAAGAPVWVGALTSRESDVLKRVARGLSNKEIGRELGLAEITIKLHMRNVFRKTGARSRSEAAVMASKANLA
jgi:two-component system nitrate/nitrite response regulator NarL